MKGKLIWCFFFLTLLVFLCFGHVVYIWWITLWSVLVLISELMWLIIKSWLGLHATLLLHLTLTWPIDRQPLYNNLFRILTNEWILYATSFHFHFHFTVAHTEKHNSKIFICDLYLSLSFSPTRLDVVLCSFRFYNCSYCDLISFINGKQNIKIKRIDRNQSCCCCCCYVIQLNWFHENRPQIKQTKKKTQSKWDRDVTWKKKRTREINMDRPSEFLWYSLQMSRCVPHAKTEKRKKKYPNERWLWLHKLCVCVSSMIFNRT